MLQTWSSRGLVWFSILLATSAVLAQSRPKVGYLAGQVLYGESPTPRAFVYVHSLNPKFDSIIDLDSNGKFRVALTPGLYDVFVSEVSFVPMCKRLEIIEKQETTWNVTLRTDDEHLER